MNYWTKPHQSISQNHPKSVVFEHAQAKDAGTHSWQLDFHSSKELETHGIRDVQIHLVDGFPQIHLSINEARFPTIYSFITELHQPETPEIKLRSGAKLSEQEQSAVASLFGKNQVKLKLRPVKAVVGGGAALQKFQKSQGELAAAQKMAAIILARAAASKNSPHQEEFGSAVATLKKLLPKA